MEEDKKGKGAKRLAGGFNWDLGDVVFGGIDRRTENTKADTKALIKAIAPVVKSRQCRKCGGVFPANKFYGKGLTCKKCVKQETE